MFVWPEKMTYALPETIGNTDLFVGRKKEFDFFLGRWYDRLQKNAAQSQAVVARRKKGKTAFLQRFFNILWSCPDSGVIPCYYSIPEKATTLARIMLYLFNAEGERTRQQILEDLKLEMTEAELEAKLFQLIKADLISRGESDYDYKISRDMTYELVFRSIYQKEIEHFVPDIRQEIRKAMGETSHTMGKCREFLIKGALKKPFNLKDLAENGIDLLIRPKEILERQRVKIGVGEREIDLIVKGNHELWIDIKDTKHKYGKSETDPIGGDHA